MGTGCRLVPPPFCPPLFLLPTQGEFETAAAVAIPEAEVEAVETVIWCSILTRAGQGIKRQHFAAVVAVAINCANGVVDERMGSATCP